MLRLLLATISFLSLTACTVDAVPDGDDGDGGGGGSGGPGGDGGRGSGGGGRDDGLTLPAYLTALSMKKCDDAFTCRATYPADSGVPFDDVFGDDQAACYGERAEYYDAEVVQASIAAGKIAYDGVAAAACIAGIGAPTCATFWTAGPSYPAACEAALVGTIPDGAACAIDFECANRGSVCDRNTKKCVRRVR